MSIAETIDDIPRETSELRRALGRLLRRKSAVLGLIIAVLLVTLAVLAPLVAPFDPVKQSYTMVRKAPSLLHWFGTDESGRDILSRVIFGARASAARKWASW
jgi:peptide/nickel transport system permease protein